MNKTFAKFDLLLQIGLGAVAFAALICSPIELSLKVFLGAALLLIAYLLDAMAIQSSVSREALLELYQAGIRTLEGRIGGESVPAFDAEVESHLRRWRLRDIAEGQGVAYVYVLSGKYLGWVICGWLLADYVVPRL